MIFKPSVQKMRLMAQSEDDLSALSTLLQDAVIIDKGVIYDPKAHSFTLYLNRFCHEQIGAAPLRSACVLQFNSVLRVVSRGVDLANPLSLLHIKPRPQELPDYIIDLVFAGQSATDIRLYVECIDVLLLDLVAPRRAKSTPRHEG